MSKQQVETAWFDRLTTATSHYEWLASLRASVEKVVSFGCITSEPFYLLWTLDAVEIKVVEAIEENLATAKEDKEVLEKAYPKSLDGRSIEFIAPRDMSERINDLPLSYFDLAYCDRVLYNMSPDLGKIQRAISSMTHAVKPKGYIIAVDEKITDEIGAPKNITHLFKVAGLQPVILPDIPEHSYCYQKRDS